MSSKGTLLQDAIQSKKQDFVRILLEYGFVCLPIEIGNFNHFRVDPTAISDVKQITPLDIALQLEDLEVLHVLAKFMEMPDYVKLIQLALLVNSDKAEESNEELHRILTSLPVDMVGNITQIFCDFHLIRSVPQGLNNVDVEQFYKMVYRTANLTLSEICWNSGELFSFDQSRCFSSQG